MKNPIPTISGTGPFKNRLATRTGSYLSPPKSSTRNIVLSTFDRSTYDDGMNFFCILCNRLHPNSQCAGTIDEGGSEIRDRICESCVGWEGGES